MCLFSPVLPCCSSSSFSLHFLLHPSLFICAAASQTSRRVLCNICQNHKHRHFTPLHHSYICDYSGPMASNNASLYSKVLSKCTNDILKRIVITCGFKATIAKKDERINSIISGLILTSSLPPKFDIIGVDIGLKNFAYCKLEMGPTKPKIMEWNKFDLHKKYIEGYEPILNSKYDRDNILSENLVDSTRYLSYLSNKIITEIIFPRSLTVPAIAVIEHQRTRSVGQSSTLPNVMNNFLLENMLYASFYTYQREGKQTNAVTGSLMNPVYSQSMAYFWINRFVEELTDNNKKFIVKHSKSMRTKLVYHWLNRAFLNDDKTAANRSYPFSFDAEVPKLDSLINSKKPYISHANKPNMLLQILQIDECNVTNFKIDDLVDSLLHALSYASYHHNKIKLINVLTKCVKQEEKAKELILEYVEERKEDQLVLYEDLIEEMKEQAGREKKKKDKKKKKPEEKLTVAS